jgi:hypothetical protein
MRRAHKYGAIPTTIDGIRFASKKEAGRYLELRLLEKAGEIRGLELQPKFPLLVPVKGRMGVYETIGKYIADFRYRAGKDGLLVIEDVKSTGTKTTVYRLKKRMVEAIYGIEITEV